METSINWFEVIQAAASVAVALIALSALTTWKRQDKAKREAEFLDALVDTAHAYIAEMATPITFVQIAKIGMESHIPSGTEDQIQGAIAYIVKDGQHVSQRLNETLERARPLASHLRALVAKGQVFNFSSYAKCHDAVAMLTWQIDRIEAFRAIIGSTTMNWKHPDVIRQLNMVLDIDPDDIRQHIEKNNISIIEFSRETYNVIYM